MIPVHNPDIICIVESWLDKSILDCELTILNYNLLRLDRNRHGGGILIYIRDSLSFSLVLSGPNNLEFLCVTIHSVSQSQLHANSFCLGVLYNPPDNVCYVLSTLTSVLQTLPPSMFSNFLLLGDFNVNYFDTSSTAFCQLDNLLSSFNLFQVVQEPTRIATSGNATLIDLAPVSKKNVVENCSVLPPLVNSDHNGISLTITISMKKPSKRISKRTVWKYSKADFAKASDMIDDFDWDSLFHGKNIDEACSAWEETLLSIMEQCIPKGKLPKKRNVPWASRNIRRIILKRDHAYKRYRRTGDTLSKLKYKQLRNKVVHELRRAKKSYVNNIARAKNPKQFWAAIKALNGNNSSNIPTLSCNNETVTDDKKKAEVLNSFFHSCFNPALPPLSTENLVTLDPTDCPGELLCTEEEVFDLLLALDTNKSNGPDGISAHMLRGVACGLTPVLVKLFNLSITSCSLPSSWKTSRVVPIPKGSCTSPSPSNYRPISLLSITSKLLEKIIYSRITTFLDSSYPLAANQWGFLPGRSTTHALLSAVHDWLSSMEDGHEMGAVFFDLTKAFDSVPHRQLISKLRAIGLDDYLVSWITSYLTYRNQSVVLHGETSDLLPVTSGVPQGSVLGPLLFLLYVNDVNDVALSEGTKLILYADDILLYRRIYTEKDYAVLQQDVDSLGVWSLLNHLSFNPVKCKSMVLSRKKVRTTPPPLNLLGSEIEQVDSIKYLGLTINDNLSWSDHISKICSKARRLIGMLFRQFYNCADTSTIRTLYLTLIRPHLEYANQVWDPYLVKDCKLLEDVQKFACKVCLKSWNTTYDEMLDTLNIPKLEQRRKALKLCFMHKLVGTNAPVLVPLVPRPCVYTTRYTHSKQLSSLSGHTAQYLNSFFPNTITSWNKLSSDVVSSPFSTFKNHVYNNIALL